jgi:sugar/nucleoside kinase (ribokinase family)
MSNPILTLGELLAECIRPGVDQPLDCPGQLLGPFPSGAPVIFIATAARLGWPAAMIGVVGADPFGQMLVGRLAADGVDVRGIRVTPDAATAVSFVAYGSDGSRQFIFHLADSAAGRLRSDDVSSEIASSAVWLHVSGSAMAINASMRAACLRALELAPAARVSLDPNLRVELLGGVEQARTLFAPVVARAEVVFPSAGELEVLTGEVDLDRGVVALLSQGPRLVVIKHGPAGCSVYSAAGQQDIPGFPAEEVDPTGAGDAFAAGFVVAILRGMPPAAAARYANAVGSLAVRRRGPMEGANSDAEVRELLTHCPRASSGR